jgi:hypothetical protein
MRSDPSETANVCPPAHGMFPQMSGFDLNASTPQKVTKANRQARGRQLCTPSVFESEMSRTTG